MKNAPDVSVHFVIKDKSEWDDFIEDLNKSLGFEYYHSPICYTLEGELIGGGK